MLSPAERQALAEIEAQVHASDPELARLLSERRAGEATSAVERRRGTWPLLLWLLLAQVVMALILAISLALGHVDLPPAEAEPTPIEAR